MEKKEPNFVQDVPLDGIEHVIVVMFENRSFDNVLGGLYPASRAFNGVPKDWSNPFDLSNPKSPEIKAWQATGKTSIDPKIMPFPDPKEDHFDMGVQIDGGSMKGFAYDYNSVVQAGGPGDEKLTQIMHYFTQEHMPVTYRLAAKYAVSDTYFGSGPVQTWPNRIFAHCGTPGHNGKMSYLNNKEYPSYPLIDGQLSYPSIFKLLDDKFGKDQINWKVYYDGELPISNVVDYVYSHWNKVEPGGNVCYYKSDDSEYHDFFYDLKHKQLPKYSFIEPRYQQATKSDPTASIPPNSNHPGSASLHNANPPINIDHGEDMLSEIYYKLSLQPDLFDKTLLIVTYDEHGGTFDHVTPPAAVSPFVKDFHIENFTYDVYGPRVPAIFINPRINKKVLRPSESGKCFDHTSIISTLCAQFKLDGPLTPRDAAAPKFEKFLNPPESEEEHVPVDFSDLNLNPSKPVQNKERLWPKELPEKEYGTVGYAIYHTAFLADQEKKENLEDKKEIPKEKKESARVVKQSLWERIIAFFKGLFGKK